MGCAICKSPPFIFTHIPKTGGTSFMSRRSPVLKQLMPHCKGLTVMNGHRYLHSLGRGCRGLILSNYFKFTIVRNPYDRFISLWLTRTANKDLKLTKDATLNQFINLVKNRKVPWTALKTQSSWVCARNGKLLINHFIKYEDYENEINKTLNNLGLPSVILPHLRKTNRDRDYTKYYETEEQIQFVRKMYELDFENFNYEKEAA